ncbi:MAG: hypothetical protein O7C59_11605, partial [Rickettsia endosymbiont of Ixodes persulcatus]|nr:hypothetical protein [Rickettsia endosymbiont of Ixodes persulcatus]
NPQFTNKTIYITRTTNMPKSSPFIKMRPKNINTNSIKTIFPWQKSNNAVTNSKLINSNVAHDSNLFRLNYTSCHTYANLHSYLPNISPAQRRNRHLTTNLPKRPDVYLFQKPTDKMLYIETTINLQRHVSQYFTNANPHTQIKKMTSLTTRIEHIKYAHNLKTNMQKLQLLTAHTPPYNQRSKFPHQ